MTTPAPFTPIAYDGNFAEYDRPGAPYYIVAGDGLYIHKPVHYGHVIVPIEKAANLPELGAPAVLFKQIPKIPTAMLGQAWSFFRDVFNEQKTEAMLDITWHREHGYRFYVPQQDNTTGHVNARRNPAHYSPGWRLVATIHSHCNFAAFHSGTDKADAAKLDGLHMTIGHVDTDHPQWAAMIAIGGNTWDLKLDEVTDGSPDPMPYPAWWHRYVNTEKFASETKPATTNGSVVPYRGPASTPPVTQMTWRDDNDDEQSWRKIVADFHARRQEKNKPKDSDIYVADSLTDLADLLEQEKLIDDGTARDLEIENDQIEWVLDALGKYGIDAQIRFSASALDIEQMNQRYSYE